ncbi:MAG: hypothetical protein OXT09_30350 [Myxococcales bacterium]|nr:hypothetical protein [Myxococcales bacterium]
MVSPRVLPFLVLATLVGCSDAHDVPGETPVSIDAIRGGGGGAAAGDARGDEDPGGDGDQADGDQATDEGDTSSGAPDGDGDGDTSGDGAGADPSGASCQPCGEVSSPFGSFSACCDDSGACGLDFGALTGSYLCVQQNAPGELSDACPSQNLMGFPLPGCCPPSGTCGVLIETFVPLGCVDIGDLAMGLPIGDLPPDVPCDP